MLKLPRIIAVFASVLAVLAFTSCAKKQSGAAKKKNSSARSSSNGETSSDDGGDDFSTTGLGADSLDFGTGTLDDSGFDTGGTGTRGFDTLGTTSLGTSSLGTTSFGGTTRGATTVGGITRGSSTIGGTTRGVGGIGAGGIGRGGVGRGGVRTGTGQVPGNGPQLFMRASGDKVLVYFNRDQRTDGKLTDADRHADITLKYTQKISSTNGSTNLDLNGALDVQYNRRTPNGRIERCTLKSNSFRITSTANTRSPRLNCVPGTAGRP